MPGNTLCLQNVIVGATVIPVYPLTSYNADHRTSSTQHVDASKVRTGEVTQTVDRVTCTVNNVSSYKGVRNHTFSKGNAVVWSDYIESLPDHIYHSCLYYNYSQSITDEDTECGEPARTYAHWTGWN